MSAAETRASEEVGRAVLSSPPKTDCYRSIAEAPALRPERSSVMVGRFAEFETWTEINSAVEGHFMERLAPTAFAKTVRENRGNMRVLFHHGRDASVGFQVLGTIEQLEQDTSHEVELFESVPQLIMDGLRAGQYGSSYRFAIVNHDWVRRPKRSSHNPSGLPELTILEAKVREFGPTPIPQYSGTSSGIRSVTDEILLDALAEDPDRFEQMLRGRSHASLNGLESDRSRSSDRDYKRSVDAVGSAVWAIRPDALAVILGIIGERANGIRPTEEEIRARIGMRAESEPVGDDKSPVAVISILGPIVPRADLFSDVSGAVSIEELQARFQAAVADPAVAAIVLDIDSPGGDAKMVPELAAEIIAARGSKPIVAVANSMAASGAYWLASAADEIVVTPSGEVGSIGVYTSHTDISAAQEKAGIKTTLVAAGEYKVERNPFAPLSSEAQGEMQDRVDAIYENFVLAVAEGRGVDVETVKESFGKGRMMLAPNAVKAGLADKIGTLKETVSRLEKATAKASSERSEPDAPERTTPAEPEPSEATTHSDRGLFWFAEPPAHMKE